MRALVVGDDARAQAWARALARSLLVEEVFVAPGHALLDREPGCVRAAVHPTDPTRLAALAATEGVHLVIPADERAVLAGLRDACDAQGVRAFAPLADEARALLALRLAAPPALPCAAALPGPVALAAFTLTHSGAEVVEAVGSFPCDYTPSQLSAELRGTCTLLPDGRIAPLWTDPIAQATLAAWLEGLEDLTEFMRCAAADRWAEAAAALRHAPVHTAARVAVAERAAEQAPSAELLRGIPGAEAWAESGLLFGPCRPSHRAILTTSARFATGVAARPAAAEAQDAARRALRALEHPAWRP